MLSALILIVCYPREVEMFRRRSDLPEFIELVSSGTGFDL